MVRDLYIKEMETGEEKQWDIFVENHPEGRFCHLSGYKKVIEESFGLKSYYLIVYYKNKPVLLFPSFLLRSFILGKKIISQPFSEYGGILSNQSPVDGYNLLIKKIDDILKDEGIPFLEMHTCLGISKTMSQYFFEAKLHEYAILKLTSADDVWKNKMDKHLRRLVRVAEGSGLEVFEKTDENTIKKHFYPLYLISMKRFGTPPLPEKFFINCYKYLKKNTKLFLVNYEGRIISSLLGFTTGKRVHIISIASDTKYWDKRPNDLVHWEFIKWACNKRYDVFDFGPVSYEGQRRFKKKWGVEFHEYSYFYYPTEGRPITPKRFDPLSKIYKTLPLSFSKAVGPYLRKQLGV